MKKISHIQINDFLGIESLSLELQAPINIIVGVNGAKKSCIKDAVKWCLTGAARGCKTHVQQASLIRLGGKATEVKITQVDGQITSRRRTPKTDAVVSGPVPDDQVMAAVMCDPLTYFSFPEDQRRELLFKLIPGLSPAASDIAIRLSQTLGEKYDESAVALVDELAKLAATDGFKAAKEEAVTRRRIAGRICKDCQVKEPAKQADIGGRTYILPDFLEAEVQKKLARLQTERDELLQQRGKVEAELGRLPEMEKEFSQLDANPVAPSKPGEVEKWQGTLQKDQATLEQLQKEVDSLEQGSPGSLFPAHCPAISCPCPCAGKEAIAPTAPADPARAKELRAKLVGKQRFVKQIEQRLAEALSKQAAYEDYTKKRQDLAAKIVELKKQQKQAVVTAELDQQIAALDTRIKNGFDLLTKVQDFWRDQKAAEVAAVKLAAAQKENTLYDALADALAPEGIQSRFIVEALKPLNELLQAAADYLFPGLVLSMNKELSVELSGIPYATLAESEQFRVGAAFQYALAKLAGARLLMLDRADVLDPHNRSRLYNFLLEILPDFDTIMVFATSDHAKPSPVPEIQVWWLEDGKISAVNQKLAA